MDQRQNENPTMDERDFVLRVWAALILRGASHTPDGFLKALQDEDALYFENARHNLSRCGFEKVAILDFPYAGVHMHLKNIPGTGPGIVFLSMRPQQKK